MRGILPQKRNHLEIVIPSEVEGPAFARGLIQARRSPFVPASRQRYTAEPKSALPDLLCVLSKQQLEGSLQRATQVQQPEGESILAPLSGS